MLPEKMNKVDLKYVESMIKKYSLIIGFYEDKYWVAKHDYEWGYFDSEIGVIDSHLDFVKSDENLVVALEKCIVAIEKYKKERQCPKS